MRLFDCVIVDKASDLDLLEARFEELQDIPGVIHVIAEAETDYYDAPKPLWFWDRRGDRFGRWLGRWNHVRVHPPELPRDADPRVRKDALREYLAHGIHGDPDDLIAHGGVDEIPAEWAVREVMSAEGMQFPVTLEMRWCAFNAGRVHPAQWRGTTVQRWNRTGSFAGLRENKNAYPALLRAGTRLSMMGGDGDRHPDGHALWDAVVDESWPRVVREGRCPAGWLPAGR